MQGADERHEGWWNSADLENFPQESAIHTVVRLGEIETAPADGFLVLQRFVNQHTSSEDGVDGGTTKPDNVGPRLAILSNSRRAKTFSPILISAIPQ